MTKPQLQEILAGSFSKDGWLDVLKDIFSVKRLHQEPQAIALPSNEKADAAFELGSLDTSDDRLIGLYLVEVKPNVWLEENRVGLRNLLRNIYKYDVDGALVVFTQKDKWRLSFVSEIRVANEDGELMDQVTEPKRYTYFLGEGEKVKTPTDRIFSLKNKPLSLEDIREAFSVEALNEEFYKIVARQFYKLVGATEGKGAKIITHDRTLQLPSVSADNRKTYQEFAVRLIGRTVFCWFLKMKKPAAVDTDHGADGGIPLLPEFLLSSQAVRKNKGYYHRILELLFFETLNTPMDQRRNDLPKGTETIPFLNGGLFEPQTDDFYKPDPQTGLSKNLNTLVIPDEWFEEFFEKLEQFNFTIDENSVVDVEVSVDPEMLGRIFENLLAEIDPDSGETARKATGSFYTPREIVDYMASESLVQYLVNKTGLDEKHLHPLFRLDQEVTFSKPETHTILDALDKLKILDPACGSGAFPIGVLQKIVMALQKLDPDAKWWIDKQVNNNKLPSARKAVREKLEQSPEYARKIGIIQNSLYGVDIQPIAAEISKLRCFLTLIVDEKIEESKENRGIEPLPNLEFKFVTADSLVSLPNSNNFGGIFNANTDLDELQNLRRDYLESYGSDKEKIKERFKAVQDQVYQKQLSLGGAIDVKSREYLISTWNPFGHDKVDWFDTEWMFGEKSFDLVIGNPPYLRLQGVKATNPDFVPYAKANYKSAQKGNWDMYVLFTEKGYQLLNLSGVLAYIQPHKFFQADFGVGIRKLVADDQALMKVVHFGAEQVFNSATNYTCLFFLEKQRRKQFEFVDASSPEAWKRTLHGREGYWLDQPIGDEKWNFSDPTTQRILDALNKQTETLADVTRKIFVGLQTSADKIYVLNIIEDLGESYLLYSSSLDQEVEIEKGLVKPFLMGKDVKRYHVPQSDSVVIFPYSIKDNKAVLMSEKHIRENYPNGWSYVLENKSALEDRESGKMKHDQFYAYIYPKNLVDFDGVKIMTRDIANGCEFTIDQNSKYHTTTVYSFSFEKSVTESDYYWLGLLNSKLLWYFLQATGNVMRGGYFRFKTEYLRPFPVRRIDFDNSNDKESHEAIAALVRHVLILNIQDREDEPINFYVPNQHIGAYFQQVIDGCFFDLYFPDHVRERNLAIIKPVVAAMKKVFGEIPTGKSELDFSKISKLYDELSSPDGPVKNRMLKFPIESPDFLKPILQS